MSTVLTCLVRILDGQMLLGLDASSDPLARYAALRIRELKKVLETIHDVTGLALYDEIDRDRGPREMMDKVSREDGCGTEISADAAGE